MEEGGGGGGGAIPGAAGFGIQGLAPLGGGGGGGATPGAAASGVHASSAPEGFLAVRWSRARPSLAAALRRLVVTFGPELGGAVGGIIPGVGMAS